MPLHQQGPGRTVKARQVCLLLFWNLNKFWKQRSRRCEEAASVLVLGPICTFCFSVDACGRRLPGAAPTWPSSTLWSVLVGFQFKTTRSCLQACRPRSESFAQHMSPDGKKCCSELAPGTKQSEFWGPKTGSRFRHGFKCWATWRTHFWVRISTPKTGPQNAEKRNPPFVAARRNVAQSRAACAPTSHTATLARCLSTRYGRCRFMSCYSMQGLHVPIRVCASEKASCRRFLRSFILKYKVSCSARVRTSDSASGWAAVARRYSGAMRHHQLCSACYPTRRSRNTWRKPCSSHSVWQAAAVCETTNSSRNGCLPAPRHARRTCCT